MHGKLSAKAQHQISEASPGIPGTLPGAGLGRIFEVIVLEAAPVLPVAFWRPEQRCMGTPDVLTHHGLNAGGKLWQVMHSQKVQHFDFFLS